MIHEHGVHHGGLVHHQKSAGERIVLVAVEAVLRRTVFQQTMYGLGLQPARLGHSLGGAARWRGKEHACLGLQKNLDDGVQDGGLARAGTAGEHHDLGGCRGIHGLLLLFCQRHGHGVYDLSHELLRLGNAHGLRRVQEPLHVEGYFGLVNIVARKVHALVISKILDDHALFPLQIDHGLVGHVRGNGKPGHGLFHKKIARVVNVPVLGEAHEQVEHARLGAQRARLVEAELAGKRIRGGEAYAVYVHGEAVGILAHHGKGLRAVLAIDAHRHVGGHAVGLKKDHELAYALMLRPGSLHGLKALLAESRQLQHAVRIVIHDVERVRAEMRHDAVGPLGAYALDAAGGKKETYALFRGRKFLLTGGHLNLPAEFRMIDPATLHAKTGAGLRRGQTAHDHHRVFPPLDTEPEYRPAVFLVVKDHPLQSAGKLLRPVGVFRGQHIHLFHDFRPGRVMKKEKPGSPHAGLFTTPLMYYYKREISSRQAPSDARHASAPPAPVQSPPSSVCRARARHACNPQQFRLRRSSPEASCQRHGKERGMVWLSVL